MKISFSVICVITVICIFIASFLIAADKINAEEIRYFGDDKVFVSKGYPIEDTEWYFRFRFDGRAVPICEISRDLKNWSECHPLVLKALMTDSLD